MDVEFNTPIPVTLMGLARFVFYFKPLLVADTFDNIPQFYLDIAEKGNTENMQRLYITCKMQEHAYFLDPEEVDTKAQAVAIQLKDYLKKHFGSKLVILETMTGYLDNVPCTMREIISDIFNRWQMISDKTVSDFLTISKSFEGSDANLVRISPALLGPYIFTFWDKLPKDHVIGPPMVLSGKAILFGEPKIFEIDSLAEYKLPAEVFRQFISPRLVQDTLNRSLRVIYEKGEYSNETYIRDVEIDKEE